MCNLPASPKLLRLPEVLKRMSVSRSTLWAWVKSGKFPQPIRIGPRFTAWLESDVEAFILGLLPQPLTT